MFPGTEWDSGGWENPLNWIEIASSLVSFLAMIVLGFFKSLPGQLRRPGPENPCEILKHSLSLKFVMMRRLPYFFYEMYRP